MMIVLTTNRKLFLQNSLHVASGPIGNTEANIAGWKSIHLDPNEDNAMVFLDKVILIQTKSIEFGKN